MRRALKFSAKLLSTVYLLLLLVQYHRQLPTSSTLAPAPAQNNDTKYFRPKPVHTDLTSDGARHPNGTVGMIVDPSPERLHLPVHDLTTNSLFCPPGPASHHANSSSIVGFEGKEANAVLQKIRRGVITSRAYLQSLQHSNDHDTFNAAVLEENGSKLQRRKSRILCMVYTVCIPGENNHSNVRSQAETWGRQCDGFIAASNFTDHSVGAIDLVHNGPEEYANMWQKVRSMLAYAYQHYYHDFDFFHICGDDVYIAMDNLRAYLDGPEVIRLEDGYIDKISSGFGGSDHRQVNEAIKRWSSVRPRPLLFGLPFKHKNMPVVGGGPGYTLNRATLKFFSEHILYQFLPNAVDSREDMFIGGALSERGILVSDTKDTHDGDRYGESATTIYNFKGVSPTGTKWLTQRFGLKYNVGIDSISEQFIASHLKDSKKEMLQINRTIPELMHRYHVILNGLCENNNDG